MTCERTDSRAVRPELLLRHVPRNGFRTAVFVASLLLVGVSTVSAVSAAGAPDLSQSIGQLKSDTWQARSAAFSNVVALGAAEAQRKAVKPALTALLAAKPQQADALKLGLIGALELENMVVRRGASLPEAFTDYYGDLILAVSSLNDTRAVKALAGALGTGNMATSSLVAFGDAAVDAVLDHIAKSPDGPGRRSGCLVLQRWTEPSAPVTVKDPAKLQRVGQTLASPACVRKG